MIELQNPDWTKIPIEHIAEGTELWRTLAAVMIVLGVATEPLLVQPGPDGVIGASRLAQLLVVGLSSRWREEGLGDTRLNVLSNARPATVLVRRGVRPGGLAPAEAQTRFTWSLAGVSDG